VSAAREHHNSVANGEFRLETTPFALGLVDYHAPVGGLLSMSAAAKSRAGTRGGGSATEEEATQH
jgi:hypothetical protein